MVTTEQPQEPASSSRARGLTALAVVSAAVVQTVAGWHLYFSYLQFPSIDDEGYVVTIVRQWTEGGALYDEVYSQYGPFPTVVFSLPFRLTGIDLTLTSGRMITLALIVLTSVLLAGVVWVLTHNPAATLAAQVAAFMLLDSVSAISMHPASLVALLLALVLLNVTALRPRAPDLSDALTGALTAALVLTKVNVGLFTLVAVVYVVAQAWPSPRVKRYLLPISELAVVAVGPFLLLRHIPMLDEARSVGLPHDPDRLVSWSVAYVALAVAVLFVGRLQRGPRADRVRPFAITPLAMGFGSVVLVILIVVMSTGTTLSALVESVFIRPLGTGDALTALAVVPVGAWAWVLGVPLLLVGAWAIARAPSSRTWLFLSGAVRVGAGSLIMVMVVITTIDESFRFEFTGELVWVPLIAALVLPRVGEGAVRNVQARQLFSVLCVTQTLHAFPIASVQKDLGLLLIAVASAVVLADGGLEWAAALAPRPSSYRARLLAMAPATLLLVTLIWFSADDMARWRDQYRDGVPIDLPGTDWIRAPAPSVAALRSAVGQLDGCEQFATYPSWNSFYLFTETAPPTGFNATIWEELLSADEQEDVIKALEAVEGRVCYLRLTNLQPTDADNQPLLAYLEGFDPTGAKGPIELKVRADR